MTGETGQVIKRYAEGDPNGEPIPGGFTWRLKKLEEELRELKSENNQDSRSHRDGIQGLTHSVKYMNETVNRLSADANNQMRDLKSDAERQMRELKESHETRMKEMIEIAKSQKEDFDKLTKVLVWLSALIIAGAVTFLFSFFLYQLESRGGSVPHNSAASIAPAREKPPNS